LFSEVLAVISEMIGSQERLKANVNFYEIEVKAEIEPEASPLDIMHLITPPGLFASFEDSLKVGKLSMFVYRFFYTPAKVEEAIRRTVPWYDVQFFPEIDNPDRFILDIVCRDISSEIAIRRAKELYEAALRYLADREREAGS